MALRGQGKPKPVEARNAVSKRKVKENAAPIAAQRAHESDGSQTAAKIVNGAS